MYSDDAYDLMLTPCFYQRDVMTKNTLNGKESIAYFLVYPY